ncbi:hypothetical protein C6568_06365 [Melaminivora suipulveris]|uniref:Urea transporter n=1 Tax=Melaminivora suipulveris TaxID=2109913 RepID=A0A2R3QAU8_9BURK|nr:urea transporter [Melaminivora suipulveris]AVO48913.1 hypothetical protein C6568_06365 [Melaminivora suipulveris]
MTARPLWPALPRLAPWARGADALLRGAGQVVFMDSSRTGALFLFALLWGAWAGGTTWAVVLAALSGAAASTAVGRALGAPRDALHSGLYGFNGLLVGAGVATFIAPSAAMWTLALLAAALSSVLALALQRVLRDWDLPGLTLPFIVSTWLMLLAVLLQAAIATAVLPLGIPVLTLPFVLATWVFLLLRAPQRA